MCNMCIYSSIPLIQLPASNPWLADDIQEPEERVLPSSIVVESPYAKKYTAWSNPRRFPSLHQTGSLSAAQQISPSSTSVTILGPQQLSKQMSPMTYQAYCPEPRDKQQTRLERQQQPSQHHHRQSRALQQRLSICTTSSASSSTEDVSYFSSPESDDEFLYLQDSQSRQRTSKPIAYVVRNAKPIRVEIPSVPRPQAKRHADWMSDACRNF